MMNDNFQCALQPDHPSAPVVGQAISAPPCERGIALYPVRYGIADQPMDQETFQTLSVESYPSLRTAKPYGLRLLRPGCFLYLFYFQHGRMKTRHYQVTEELRFAHLWWTPEDYNSPVPGSHARPDLAGATHYVLAPATHIADTVFLMVSEALLSHASLWRIEQDDGGLRRKLATTVQPAELPMQPHVFDAAYIATAVAELSAEAATGIRATFSDALKRQDFAGRYSQALRNMIRQLGPRPGINPLAVALHDPIGVVSELHHLVTLAVEAKTRYAGQHAHRLQSAKFISGYFETAEKAAETSTETAEALVRQRKLLDYDGAMAFPEHYAKELKKLDDIVREQVEDIIAWIALMNPEQLLGMALGNFDLQVKAIADAYEETVFDCLAGLVHSKAGQQQLQQVVMMPSDRSPFWMAMSNGSQLLASRIKDKTGDIVKSAFTVLDNYLTEYAATPATNALIGLLQALPTTHKADVLVRRLRHVMEIRFNVTIVMHEMHLADLTRQAREFQAGSAQGREYLNTWKSTTPKFSQVTLTRTTYIYEWVKIGETTYQKIENSQIAKSSSNANQSHINIFSRMRKALGDSTSSLLVGLGGYLAVVNFTNSVKKAKIDTDKLSSMVDFLGASATLIGAGIEIAATAASVGSLISGKVIKATTMRYIAAKFGVAVLGAGGAGALSITDGIRGFHSLKNSNAEQAFMYFGSALAGGAVALATWAGGTGVATAIMSAAGPVAVLGLTPLGWSVIAIAALGIGIAFMIGVDLTKHGPIDRWIKHSAWGVHHRHYTLQEELNAVHNLYYRPRLAVEWRQTPGHRVGTLQITYQLPNTPSDSSNSFQSRLSVRRDQYRLAEINGPIIHSSSHKPFDPLHECLITPTFRGGKPSGWSIQMHRSATVFLEYLFTPDPNQPDLELTQPGAPTPLQFQAADIMTLPIAPAKLEPVQEPGQE